MIGTTSAAPASAELISTRKQVPPQPPLTTIPASVVSRNSPFVLKDEDAPRTEMRPLARPARLGQLGQERAPPALVVATLEALARLAQLASPLASGKDPESTPP